MSKKARIENVGVMPDSLPTSDKDAGYRFARTGETAETIARYLVGRHPSFPAEVPDTLKLDLNAGFMMRAHELWGEDVYMQGEGNTLIKLANTKDHDHDEKTKDKKGLSRFSLNIAYAISAQEFGQLRNRDPQRHSILKHWRDRFSKYSSNNMSALKLQARLILSDGKSRERGATKSFSDALTEVFELYDKRVKTASARGDETANEVKYRMARDAFWKAYKV